MSMSHKLKMFDLERDGEVSITQQLVTLFATLIDSGELAPGERLPATRAVAADVSINHLTAVRVYRRLAALAAQIGRDTPRAITDYLQVEGLPELRERLAEIGRAVGFATSADEILVTTGARQGIDLVARAVLGPGDVAVVESPTFAGSL